MTNMNGKCPNCGSQITQGHRFCMACGAAIPAQPRITPKVCKRCGNTLSESAIFCERCGFRNADDMTSTVNNAARSPYGGNVYRTPDRQNASAPSVFTKAGSVAKATFSKLCALPKSVLIISGAIVLTLVAGVVVLVSVGGGDKSVIDDAANDGRAADSADYPADWGTEEYGDVGVPEYNELDAMLLEEAVPGIPTWELTADGILIISGTGAMEDMIDWDVIEDVGADKSPDAPWYNDRSSIHTVVVKRGITSVGELAFAKYTSLNCVKLADTVTTLGEECFLDCTSLAVIDLPDGVLSITDGMFSGCVSLVSVGLPSSLTHIGEKAFLGCTALSGIDLPSSVKEIGYQAFNQCTALTQITLPASVENLGELLFKGCEYLESVTFADNSVITSLPYGVFYGCIRLNNIILPDSLTFLGSGLFSNCTSLTGITIPAKVTALGGERHVFDYYGTFFGCKNLGSVVFSDNKTLTTIGGSAFEGCSKLPDIDIPESVTVIQSRAFYDCARLTSVEFPNALQKINRNAFYNCSSLSSVHFNSRVLTYEIFNSSTPLTDVYFSGSESDWPREDIINSVGMDSITIHYNS